MRVREIIVDPDKGWDDTAPKLERWVRDTQSILNGGVTLKDQPRAVIKTFQFRDGEESVLRIDGRTIPAEVRVLRSHSLTSPAVYQSGGAVTWGYAEGVVRITSIGGLATSGVTYSVTVLVVED